jgi:hypothetical protein
MMSSAGKKQRPPNTVAFKFYLLNF